MSQKIYNWPEQVVTLSPSPIQYDLNGVPTVVNKDTVTPANSTPLPVEVLSGGTPINLSTLAQETTLSALNTKVVTTANGIKVDVQASALPTGAATSVNQTNGTQKTQIVDGSGNVIASTGNALNVALSGGATITTINGVVSTVNSSTTPLAIGASFTGTSENITDYSAVDILVTVDRSGVLNMQFSSDGTNWDHDDAYACTVTTGGVAQSFYFQSAAVAKYFRVVYVNDGTAQGIMRLQTIYKVNPSVGDIQDLSTVPVDGSNGMITKSVIYGKTTGGGGGGGFVAVKTTPSGALNVAATQDTSPWVVSGTVAATQSGTWSITNVTGTVSLPTGAATETTLSALNTKVNADFGVSSGAVRTAAQIGNATGAAAFGAGVTGAQVLRTVLASDQAPTSAAQAWLNKITDGTNTAAVKAASTAALATDPALVVAISPNNTVSTTTGGKSKVNQIYNDYTSTNVTTSAYVQLLATTSATTNLVEVFDSSGQTMILGVGAAGSEVVQFYIIPGGNGKVPLAIPSGSRIAIKALTATASVGYLVINLYS